MCCENDDKEIIGLVAGYTNDYETKEAYISVLGIDKDFRGQSIATCLLELFFAEALDNEMEYVYLHTHSSNESAKNLYEKLDFKATVIDSNTLKYMKKISTTKGKNMNILLLSVGTRNKIVQYFKKEFNGLGKVIATDMSLNAPAIYEADKFYVVPSINDKNYMNVILEICETENISAVLSLIDPELSILSKNGQKFADIGVKVIGSSYEVCELALDKYKMYKWLIENDFNTAKSYLTLEEFMEDYEKKLVDFPVIIKPVKGSASLEVAKIDDIDYLKFICRRHEDMIIQEFLVGDEIGADVYIDLISEEVVSIFTKKKLKMRSGETDKAVSIKNDELNELIINFVNKSGFKGQIDIDVFNVDGKYYISEVNPRFGGGYPHAYESGVNHISLIKNNLLGKVNKKNIGNYNENNYMMKFNEVYVIEREC
ncbi:GNAT family N-acetyltransferase [Globicatella sanguinis]|nr:GNAT family N-acetyltransferase [Globicatella sanguinis]MDK7631223.1 GNAT family N-acetyltransferase [Globicatella sanguinis]WIK67616.1 GNAT family N-acetyltransferase [Globicatella sanguinis]WKT57021.1 GNAT family N-acetyltransferase [Globicatella sanguinis]